MIEWMICYWFVALGITPPVMDALFCRAFIGRPENVVGNYTGAINWKRWDQYHRLDGPAIQYFANQPDWVEYSQNNLMHRTGGPAHVSRRGVKSWYARGVFIKQEY